MAFVKHATTNEYVESAEDVLESTAVKGLLFADMLNQEAPSTDNEEIDIIQYPQSPDQVLESETGGLVFYS